MTKQTMIIGIAAFTASLSSGCASHRIKYTPAVRADITPRETATAVDGSLGRFVGLLQESQLPHQTPKGKYALILEATRELTSQLGSNEYSIIGEIIGSGYAGSTHGTLRKAMTKRAAKEGGDVLLVYNSSTESRPWAITTPGYTTTHVQGSSYGNLNGSAHRIGNSVYADATYRGSYGGTATTTHIPGQTFYGTMHLPHAAGIVLRHSPDTGFREAMMSLPDADFERIYAEFVATLGNPRATTKEAIDRAWLEIKKVQQ